MPTESNFLTHIQKNRVLVRRALAVPTLSHTSEESNSGVCVTFRWMSAEQLSCIQMWLLP